METTLSWVATIATIVAATITASNLGSRITGYGFIVFTIGSIASTMPSRNRAPCPGVP